MRIPFDISFFLSNNGNGYLINKGSLLHHSSFIIFQNGQGHIPCEIFKPIKIVSNRSFSFNADRTILNIYFLIKNYLFARNEVQVVVLIQSDS